MGNLKNKVSGVITGLMIGMKKTEEDMFTQLGGSTAADSTIGQEAASSRVSQALLKGELTQEVKELRYRTYTVDREAKKYEYFSPTLAKKRDNKFDSKFVKYENSDNLDIVTIQPNERNVSSINETLQNAIYKDDKTLFVESDKSYTIKIKREYPFPRYKIEEFTKRFAVFKTAKTNIYRIDLYVTKYPDDKVFISKGFVREIEKIKQENIKSDVTDITGLSFTTLHAYKMDDMIEFEFDNMSFEDIIEFDGYYIVRYNANVIKNGKDMIEQFYNEEMANKYKTHEKKELVLDLTDNFTQTYVCERCGKQILYDASSVDMLNPTQGKDINDEDEDNENNDTTEYMDIQIAEQTYGKKLCRKCLEQYINEQNEINNLK
jgi:hypothetical protein